MKIVFACLLFVVATSCVSQPKISQAPSDFKRSPAQEAIPLELGESWGLKDEQVVSKIIQATQRIALENRQAGQPLRRDAHPKHHGCVRAFWSAENTQLPPAYQVGVFKPTNTGRPAWVRLSNGDPAGNRKADSEADIRGFALKVMNEASTPKGSQDFFAMTSEQFFSRDSEDYLNLFAALRGGSWATLKYFAVNPTNARLISRARVSPAHPLKIDYFMPVPSKIVDRPMRMRFQACQENQGLSPDASPKEAAGLGRALAQSLVARGACYLVSVQLNQNLDENPVEDPTLDWDTLTSPWILAAKVVIPAQSDVGSSEQMKFCENVSFNPWNSISELRPLGQINRIRLSVYNAMSELRHAENRVDSIEPVDHNPCQNPTTQSLCR